MAVLNKIRQRSLILILVIALALFSFVIGDLFKNSDALTGGSQDVIATVNGKDINRMEFQQKVKNYQDRVGGRMTSTQSMNAIYNEELRKIVLETEFDKLGLSVEKDEMRDLLKNSFSSYPEFQDANGNFDVNRLNAYIANLKDLNGETAPLGNFLVNYDSWTNNEQTIATNAIQQTYYNLIKAGIVTTIAEAEAEYLGDAKTVDIRYVQIPYTSISDDQVEVSKSEIQAYIKKHKDTYEVDASREVVYVEFKEAPSAADEDKIKAELVALKSDRTEYNESSKNTETIPGFDSATDIEEFVNSNSDIKFNDAFLRADQLPAVAKDTLLNLNVGDYYGPYKDGEFYKLTKVLEAKQLPDSVKVRHILVPHVGGQRADASVTKTPEQAKATADSIFAKIKAGTKFMDLLELSSDKVSNEQDGEIEFDYRAGMAPEFKAYAFDNKVGDIDVVQTSFGYHIIEILEQKSFNKAIKVATLARKVEPSDETLQDVFNKMSKFEIAAKDGDFNALAEENGLTVKPITFNELDENIPGLGSQREVVRWAFSEDTKTGAFKNFPVSNFGFIVAKLVEKKDKGLMSVEDASITALPEIKKEKKAKLIREKLTGTTLADIASNQGQTVRTAAALTIKNTTLSGAGVEPKVVGAAFGLAEGTTSKPIDGDKGVYVVEVTKITEAAKLDNYNAMMNRLNSERRNGVQSKVYTALENAAEIEDNRAKTVY
ncbi:peptidyl-prolyl cis-trans isomerase D [Winogradskyella epiphytica]|uniref:Periplasmic chaperone PpiD n=1 Tax=Winogradskyella epiphytica TaxID=262005 RepID=A0A2V4XH10_9FLAO|nr:SurA N-terminal domain-containing protein [Winogradskyella epiphytica]PYE82791.1 peptidyl-prolyl cis-trans isomerase D [Winogradskyella epiphytica]GGW53638.1 peptidylprolyl isomerase [Winogradskyella epiphytica]